MAVISSRQGLVDYCLRRLGEPVLQINVDEDQIEDAVDDALQVYQEFHSDATFRTYVKHQITETDFTNRWIPIDSSIIFVSHLFPVDSSFINSTNMFSFQYQFALSDYHTFHQGGSAGIDHFVQMRQYLSMLDMTLNGTPQTTFSRRMDRLYIWGDFADGDLKVGEWVCAEVYKTINPQEFTKIYNDMFMKEYTTSLIKRIWGQNMSKFDGMQLPGGVTINARQMLDDANAEIETLRERLRLEQEFPTDFFCG